MENKYGFTKFTLDEFRSWIQETRIARTILRIQQHHTYLPSYKHFDGKNHFERQRSMKESHTVQNGWADIGQHFTIFPDGTILTGRSLEKTPACISFQNANSICIENFGNFDLGNDVMTKEQEETIIAVTAILCKKFGIEVNNRTIVYHHWYRLDNGVRNNGTGYNKSCPGTKFFKGNKVQDFEENFAPKVKKYLNEGDIKPKNNILKYAYVSTDGLNIRNMPSAKGDKFKQSLELGTIIRVYDEKNEWYKISNDLEQWVFSQYTREVFRRVVDCQSLNIRFEPSTSSNIIGTLKKSEELFEYERMNNWVKISLEDAWVSANYLI